MSPEQIQSLISDKASGQAARRLAKAKLWKELASNGRLLWGQCRSRGTRYFHTIVDISRPSYYCNCSSKKRPCSHALALYFLFGDGSDAIRSDNEVPEWALDIRPKMKLHGAKPEAISDVEAESRRLARLAKRAKRIGEMQAGLIALEDWMADVLRQGLAKLGDAPPEFWEEQASRLVDAKLGSLARRVRAMARLVGLPDWHEQLLEAFGQLYLLIRAFEKIETLSGPMQYELYAQAGLSMRKEDILEEAPVSGTWLVIGQIEGSEEGLRNRRTWLVEKESGQFGLVLEFAWGDQSFETNWDTGKSYQGDAYFYPGAIQQRMILQNVQPGSLLRSNWPVIREWDELFAQRAQLLGQHPWLSQLPVVLHGIPVFSEEKWLLVDSKKECINFDTYTDGHWTIMALSGGHPIQLFGEWTGESFRVMSALQGDQVTAI